MSLELVSLFNLVAKEYDIDRPKFIPCFNDFYGRCTSIITALIKKEKPRILDIGTGTGLLTAYWHKFLPNAIFDIVDNSEKMLEIADARFRGVENINIIKDDYTINIPTRKYDAVISALSLHHIDGDIKSTLYKKIFDAVEEDGFFVNYDQFLMDYEDLEKEAVNDWYKVIIESGINEENFQKMLERRNFDKETTVNDELTLMRNVGFYSASCLFRYFKFAVIVANK